MCAILEFQNLELMSRWQVPKGFRALGPTKERRRGGVYECLHVRTPFFRMHHHAIVHDRLAIICTNVCLPPRHALWTTNELGLMTMRFAPRIPQAAVRNHRRHRLRNVRRLSHRLAGESPRRGVAEVTGWSSSRYCRVGTHVRRYVHAHLRTCVRTYVRTPVDPSQHGHAECVAGGAVGAGRGCWPNGGANNERTYARDDVRTYKGNERGNIWARGARQGSIKDDDVFQFPYVRTKSLRCKNKRVRTYAGAAKISYSSPLQTAGRSAMLGSRIVRTYMHTYVRRYVWI